MEDLKEQFPLGTKVIPHSKYAGSDSLKSSIVWKKAQEIGQVYLFINGYNGDELMLNDIYDVKDGGDFYLPSDVTLYTDEPSYQIF
jgi:hypothetical protein